MHLNFSEIQEQANLINSAINTIKLNNYNTHVAKMLNLILQKIKQNPVNSQITTTPPLINQVLKQQVLGTFNNGNGISQPQNGNNGNLTPNLTPEEIEARKREEEREIAAMPPNIKNMLTEKNDPKVAEYNHKTDDIEFEKLKKEAEEFESLKTELLKALGVSETDFDFSAEVLNSLEFEDTKSQENSQETTETDDLNQENTEQIIINKETNIYSFFDRLKLALL